MNLLKKVSLITILVASILVTGNITYGQSKKTTYFKFSNLVPTTKPTSTLDNTPLKNANNNFAFQIFNLLNKDEGSKNLFISPISISTALSSVYAGAETTTKEEIAKTLGYNGIKKDILFQNYKDLFTQINMESNGINIRMANSIWTNKNYTPKSQFIDLNKNIFNAFVQSVDFQQETEATNLINNWISSNTNNKINNMISPPFNNVVMFLINAIYFDGKWKVPFDENNTTSAKFTTEDGKTKSVSMMSKYVTDYYDDNGNYVENNDVEIAYNDLCKALKLPYNGDNVNMYVLLPTNGDISTFISNMDFKKFQTIKSTFKKSSEINVKIPKFKIDYGTKSLNDVLKSMGMKESFTQSADFSEIIPGIFIDSVLHKAFIDVNEAGTEAAAATVVRMNESIPPEFVVDKPFMFIIADDKNDSILFMGKASDLGL